MRNREWISSKKRARHSIAKADRASCGRVDGEGKVIRRERREACQLQSVPIRSKKSTRALGKGLVGGVGDMVVLRLMRCVNDEVGRYVLAKIHCTSLKKVDLVLGRARRMQLTAEMLIDCAMSTPFCVQVCFLLSLHYIPPIARFLRKGISAMSLRRCKCDIENAILPLPKQRSL